MEIGHPHLDGHLSFYHGIVFITKPTHDGLAAVCAHLGAYAHIGSFDGLCVSSADPQVFSPLAAQVSL